MMQYESAVIDDLEMEENFHSYPIYRNQHNSFQSTVFNSNMMSTSDIWQPSTSNSNTNYQSFYFPSSFDLIDSNQQHTADNTHFNYQPSSYLIDPYSDICSNNYSTDAYSTQVVYNSTPMETSTYIASTDSYQNHHPVYSDPNVAVLPALSSIDIQPDYQSTSSQWGLGAIKMPSHDITSTSNSRKQPCLVCREESSGYHFGAYTCESCKAFYRRVTKDPNTEIKHSCEVLLPTITKSNRKECRACRKAKCDRVGMTVIPKDRVPRPKTTSTASLIPIHSLLEQLAHDLTYNQLSTSSALENLLHRLDLPLITPINFDYYSLYMNAIHIWRNQYHHSSQLFTSIPLNDTFAVLLYLFYSLMMMKENDVNNLKFDKLVHLLQQEINRTTGTDHRLACRVKALFMKCYVALAQSYPNSTNTLDSNYNSQSVLPYEQYSIYSQ